MEYIQFKEHRISLHKEGDQLWFSGTDIAKAIGSEHPSAFILKRMKRQPFLEDGFSIIVMHKTGPSREIRKRYFSLEGFALIALASLKKDREEFKVWVVKLLSSGFGKPRIRSSIELHHASLEEEIIALKTRMEKLEKKPSILRRLFNA